MKRRIAWTSVIVLAGLAILWAIHLYLNSPDVIMGRLVSTCSEGSGWGRLFDRIDPDDKSANGWTEQRLGSFLDTVRGSEWVPVRVTFAEVIPDFLQPEPGAPLPITWNRHNERHYNIFASREGTEPAPIGSIKLRRHLDGKWYFMSAQLIGVVAKSNNVTPTVRYERYISALREAGMQELRMVRPAERLTLEALELALAGNGSTPLTYTPAP